MPVLRKKPAIRREELLDAAWELFVEQGYDTTTVQNVIERVEVAKGTFYHYFTSKEQLLDAVLVRACEERYIAASEILANDSVSAVDSLNRLFRESARWRIRNPRLVRDLFVALFRDENLLLRQRMLMKTIARIAPLIASVIERGNSEGVFSVNSPDDTTEMLLILANQLGELNAREMLSVGDRESRIARMDRRYRNYAASMERILGAGEGTIQK